MLQCDIALALIRHAIKWAYIHDSPLVQGREQSRKQVQEGKESRNKHLAILVLLIDIVDIVEVSLL